MPDELVIEYALDTPRPGYRFKPPTKGVSQDTLNAVWRSAMPRGQGWGADGFTGARSLKCFPVGARLVAASEVHVTGEEDEMGRRGLRRAEIELISARDYAAWLDARLASIPASIREAAGQQMAGYVWQRVLDRVLLRGGKRVVLTASYRGPESWQTVEALVLRLVTSPGIRMFEGWGSLTSFTTLAMTWQDEGQIVGVPRQNIGRGRGASVIEVEI